MLEIPIVSTTGASDPFCGGHALRWDGNVVWGGGLNDVEKCGNPAPCIQSGQGVDQNGPVGHKIVQLLKTSVDPPQWIDDATWPVALQREHWYPELLTLNDGKILVLGHDGAPNSDCPVPGWPYGGTDTIDLFHEVLDPVSGSVTLYENRLYDLGDLCEESSELTSVGTYGRFHLLSTGQLIMADAAGAPAQPHGWPTPATRLIDLKSPPCPGQRRFEATTGLQRDVYTKGGSSAHFVVRDSGSSSGYRDVVYYLGGIEGDDDEPAPAALTIKADVWRFKDTDTGPAGSLDVRDADWDYMAPMGHRRVNQNAVITPLGTIFVAGGVNQLAAPVLQCEEYFPPRDLQRDGSGPVVSSPLAGGAPRVPQRGLSSAGRQDRRGGRQHRHPHLSFRGDLLPAVLLQQPQA
ncbi:MAG TPA: hypothetical protein VFD43_13840 [Planctomycetota bacterium]|nr:hypothetical protein [Planctomycetota bacterium]